jgi:flagellin
VTEFNGTKLLDGSGDIYDFQIGVNNDDFQDRIKFDAGYTNARLDSLELDGLTISDKLDAQGSLDTVDNAIEQVSRYRANLGAIQNRLVSTTQNLQVTNENLQAANSRVRDVDYAMETATNARNNILNQAGTAVLAQANVNGQNALKLIG